MLKSVEAKSWLRLKLPVWGVRKSAGMSSLAAWVFSFSWWPCGGRAAIADTPRQGARVTRAVVKGDSTDVRPLCFCRAPRPREECQKT